MDTNIISVLATAENDKIGGSLRVMSFISGGNIQDCTSTAQIMTTLLSIIANPFRGI